MSRSPTLCVSRGSALYLRQGCETLVGYTNVNPLSDGTVLPHCPFRRTVDIKEETVLSRGNWITCRDGCPVGAGRPGFLYFSFPPLDPNPGQGFSLSGVPTRQLQRNTGIHSVTVYCTQKVCTPGCSFCVDKGGDRRTDIVCLREFRSAGRVLCILSEAISPFRLLCVISISNELGVG